MFKGTANKALKSATVNSNPATLNWTEEFQGNATLSTGNNNIPVAVTDGANNTKTNNYQVVAGTGSSASPTFDANGNMTSDGTNTYVWDAENRLIQVTYPGSGNNSQFTIDATGRNVKIVENTGGSSTSTRQFIWCSESRCEERDGSGSLTKEFFLQGQTISGTNYFYCKDQLGSIREMTDSSGNIQVEYAFDPNGRSAKLQGSLESDFQFASYYLHARSGLNATITRFYNSSFGRFISRDPIEESGGINLFGYAGNDPVNFSDPSGLQVNSPSIYPYGNWGGKGWTNGTWQSETSNFPWRIGQPGFKRPINPRDRCYYWHDVCLHNCARIGCKDPKKDKLYQTQRQQCRRNCDHELANCLKNVRDKYGPWGYGPQPITPGEIATFEGQGVGGTGSANDNPGNYVPGLQEYNPNYDPGVGPQ